MKQTERCEGSVVELVADEGCYLHPKGSEQHEPLTRVMTAAAAVGDWEELRLSERPTEQTMSETEYGEVVERGIRERYSLSAELAVLRQRDTKPDEFAAYNAWAEECKRRAKGTAS